MATDVITRNGVLDGMRARWSDTGGTDRAVVLLHGGVPGSTPYAACSDLWAPFVESSRGALRSVAPDLPGAGGTEARDPGDLTAAGRARFVSALVGELGLREVHLVAHADADLAALCLARNGEVPVASVTLIAPSRAVPTGDMAMDLTLASPPEPLWSRGSQRWALERLSRHPEHITDDLLDTLADHAHGAPHRTSVTWLADSDVAVDVDADLTAGAGQLYAYARDQGFAVPITIVCGANDPLVDVDRVAVLFEILSTTTAPLDLHVVGDCGHFPHREQTARVAAVVRSTTDRSARRRPSLTRG